MRTTCIFVIGTIFLGKNIFGMETFTKRMKKKLHRTDVEYILHTATKYKDSIFYQGTNICFGSFSNRNILSKNPQRPSQDIDIFQNFAKSIKDDRTIYLEKDILNENAETKICAEIIEKLINIQLNQNLTFSSLKELVKNKISLSKNEKVEKVSFPTPIYSTSSMECSSKKKESFFNDESSENKWSKLKIYLNEPAIKESLKEILIIYTAKNLNSKGLTLDDFKKDLNKLDAIKFYDFYMSQDEE